MLRQNRVQRDSHLRFGLRAVSTRRSRSRAGQVPKRLLALVVTAVVGCVAASTGLAGSTQVEQFSDGPFPDEFCGVSWMSSFHGTAVVREGAKGSFFGGTFWQVFVADNGKSITSFAAAPNRESSPMIDEQAGTVTVATTFVGLPVKVSITGGPTLIRDAGTGTFIDVFKYTGDPENPVGEQISNDVVGLHGPHPFLLDNAALCEVVGPYLLDP
jgi:hypothetical protein